MVLKRLGAYILSIWPRYDVDDRLVGHELGDDDEIDELP